MMNLTVTPASDSDYTHFARLFPELAVVESVPSLERFRETIASGTIFVRDGERVAGYAWFRERGDRLHVVHVVVDPAFRRRGVGETLMRAIAEQGRARGFERWLLNVKPENTAARALYEKCGMRAAFEAVSMTFRWDQITRLETSAGITARALDAQDDATFENALAITPKEISNFRTFPGRTIFGAEEHGSPVAVGVFDRGFPGVSPLVAPHPKHVRALLETMRPHARADHEAIYVFVENNALLEAALTTVGGVPAMRVLRMEGKIPPI